MHRVIKPAMPLITPRSPAAPPGRGWVILLLVVASWAVTLAATCLVWRMLS